MIRLIGALLLRGGGALTLFMLTANSPQHLKRLSPQEQLLRSYEDTDHALERYRLSDHADLKNAQKRLGQPLMHTELIRRIEKTTNRRVWAEDSRNDSNVVGFYFVKDGQKRYVCAFDKGALPEFSIILTDNADLAIKEKRGWRTVLTRLLESGAMSWSEVVYAFGDGLSHAAAKRWALNTRKFRA